MIQVILPRWKARSHQIIYCIKPPAGAASRACLKSSWKASRCLPAPWQIPPGLAWRPPKITQNDFEKPSISETLPSKTPICVPLASLGPHHQNMYMLEFHMQIFKVLHVQRKKSNQTCLKIYKNTGSKINPLRVWKHFAIVSPFHGLNKNKGGRGREATNGMRR